MKTSIIYSALTALTLVAGGCSKMDLQEPTPPDESNHVSISFNFAVRASGTRKTPKLESSDCSQHVTDMRIYVFRSTTGNGDASFTYYRPQVEGTEGPQDYFKIGDFNDGLPVYDHTTPDQTYSINPYLPAGYYRLLAIGRDDDADTPEDNISMAWDSNTTWSSAMISTSAPDLSGEIFVGYPLKADYTPATFHVGEVKSFSATIDLYRACSGVLLYVENLPDELVSDFSWNAVRQTTVTDEDGNTEDVDETYTIVEQGKTYSVSEIAVVAPGYNNVMNLPMRHWTYDSFIPESHEFTSTKLVSINIGDIRTNKADFMDTDGYYAVRERLGSFVLPSQLKGRKLTLNYISDGEDATEMTYTFTASMYLAFFTEVNGKSYPVKMLPVLDNRQTPHIPGGPSFYTPEEIAVEKTQFNLICNNIYCLGDYRAGGDNPGEGYPGGGDPIDDPIDLKEALNKTELNITVIGNWQADIDINL